MISEREKIVHLLNRATFGPKPGDVDRILKQGRVEYIEEQLYPERIDDSDIDARDVSFDTLSLEPGALWTKYRDQNAPTILNQLRCYKLMRAIHGKRQLREVLTDFWFNHFNVFWGKEDVKYFTTGYERRAIRPNALGNFHDLLLATAKHPAMLLYLDNAVSSREQGINENYARELMELHTLGVDGGYTQRDVEQVARCFSGWTVDRKLGDWPFAFVRDMHESGDKVVLGHRIPSGAVDEGEAVLYLLVDHPSTARFIASKLVRRFVSDDPPQSLVGRVARVFADTQGDIREMVKTILMSEEFYAPEAIGSKIKSPFELIVSAMRALDVDVQAPGDVQIRTISFGNVVGAFTITANRSPDITQEVLMRLVGQRRGLSTEVQAYSSLVQIMEEMGQFLYQHEAPDGYPEAGSHWLNEVTVLTRLNFGLALVANGFSGLVIDADKLAARFPNVAESEDAWKATFAVLTGSAAGPPDSSGAIAPVSQTIRHLSLSLGSPEFQHK